MAGSVFIYFINFQNVTLIVTPTGVEIWSVMDSCPTKGDISNLIVDEFLRLWMYMLFTFATLTASTIDQICITVIPQKPNNMKEVPALVFE